MATIKTNSQVHKEMLLRNTTNVGSQDTVGNLEQKYYTAQSGISGNSLQNKKLQTYRKQIVAAGGTNNGTRYKSDLIKQLLASKGLPVKTSLRDNLRTLEENS